MNLRTLGSLALPLSTASLSAATHYVNLTCQAPTPPYTNWFTAVTNIQDAIAATDIDDLVLVTNRHYFMSAPRTPAGWLRMPPGTRS